MDHKTRQLFEKHRRLLTHSQAQTLRDELDRYLRTLGVETQSSDMIDTSAAVKLYKGCCCLLQQYQQLHDDAKADVVACVRYFIDEHDAIGDFDSLTGYLDDIAVFNHVIQSHQLDLAPIHD